MAEAGLMIVGIEQLRIRREQMVSSARTVTFPGPVSPGLTLFPLRRGPGDPCFQVDDDGAIWRTSLMHSGSVYSPHRPRCGQRGRLHGLGERR